MKQPDNSPTLTSGTPNPQQVQRANGRRVLSRAERCALLVTSVTWFQAGCTAVQTRPDPETCSEEAVKAMNELEWSTYPGHESQPFILVDVTKGSVEEAREQPLTVWKDGPVTEALIRVEGKAPVGTRLDGHLWTTSDRIYGRYVRAHLPGERTLSNYVELQSGAALGIEKREGSKPSA